MAGFEPALSWSRTKHFTKLSYILETNRILSRFKQITTYEPEQENLQGIDTILMLGSIISQFAISF